MRRYKKEKLVEEEENSSVDEELEGEWDLKKVFIFLGVLVLLLGGGWFALKMVHLEPTFAGIFSLQPSKQIANAQGNKNETANPASSSTTSVAQPLNPQQKLDDLKKQVNNLHAEDIAKNSPQLKKLQDDLANLENLPKNQAKSACMQICSGL